MQRLTPLHDTQTFLSLLTPKENKRTEHFMCEEIEKN